MEVRVDSNRIRFERESKGWSQGHLASVAGLSLRTIQRIEKTGSASFESVTALASVLSIDVADLRVAASDPARRAVLRLSLELPMRLALAVVSGFLCALQFHLSIENAWLNLGWIDFGIGGALFAGGVLCPYLSAGRGLLPRALALVAASTLSYFSAVMALNADSWFSVPVLTSFVLASFIGVAIVLMAAKILIPLRVTAAFWLLGVAAGLVGGVAMYVGLELFGSATSAVVGYCVWHVLACLAIHRGRESSEAQNGWLAAFANTHGRFSIVPGWMRLSHSLG